jgi:hypothetical protein
MELIKDFCKRYPKIAIMAFVIGLFIGVIGTYLISQTVEVHVWHTTGEFRQVWDDSGKYETFGYVRDSSDPMITFTVPYHESKLDNIYAFYSFDPIHGSQVTITRIYIGLRPTHQGSYYNFINHPWPAGL